MRRPPAGLRGPSAHGSAGRRPARRGVRDAASDPVHPRLARLRGDRHAQRGSAGAGGMAGSRSDPGEREGLSRHTGRAELRSPRAQGRTGGDGRQAHALRGRGDRVRVTSRLSRGRRLPRHRLERDRAPGTSHRQVVRGRTQPDDPSGGRRRPADDSPRARDDEARPRRERGSPARIPRDRAGRPGGTARLRP